MNVRLLEWELNTKGEEMTNVVNLRRGAYDVYIGRRGHSQTGEFGNPVAVGRACPECGNIHRTGGSTLRCFARYMYKRMKHDPSWAQKVENLRGKTLGCFCKPAPCHGDVYAVYLDSDGDWAAVKKFLELEEK